MIGHIDNNINSISKRNNLHNKTQTNKERLNSFIHIMTTQLQNQDPTSPMEAKDFSQLLTSLIVVDQNTKTNDYLQEMLNLQKSATKSEMNDNSLLNSSAVAYIDHNITANCSIATLNQNGANFTFNLEKPAHTVLAQIYNQNNQVIFEKEIGKRSAGLNKFLWPGDEGNIGDSYRLEVYAVDHYGNRINTDYSISGLVKSVKVSDDKQVYLTLDNNAVVNLQQISSIFSNK